MVNQLLTSENLLSQARIRRQYQGSNGASQTFDFAPIIDTVPTILHYGLNRMLKRLATSVQFHGNHLVHLTPSQSCGGTLRKRISHPHMVAFSMALVLCLRRNPLYSKIFVLHFPLEFEHSSRQPRNPTATSRHFSRQWSMQFVAWIGAADRILR